MIRRKTFPLVLISLSLILVLWAQPGGSGNVFPFLLRCCWRRPYPPRCVQRRQSRGRRLRFRPMLRLIADRIARHDLAFYNQETILGGVELGLSTYPRFNSPPQEVGDAFIDTGFNLVSLANNHTLDRGGKMLFCALWSIGAVKKASSQPEATLARRIGTKYRRWR